MNPIEEIQRSNLIKLIAVGLLLAILAMAVFLNKSADNKTPLGLPIDKINQKDSVQ